MARVGAKVYGSLVASASALVTTIAYSNSEYSGADMKAPPFLIYSALPSMPVPSSWPICAAANDCSCRRMNAAASSLESSAPTSIPCYRHRCSGSFTAQVRLPLTSSLLNNSLPYYSGQTSFHPDMRPSGNRPLIPCSIIPRAVDANVCSTSSDVIRSLEFSHAIYKFFPPSLIFSPSKSDSIHSSFIRQSNLFPTTSALASSSFSINSGASSFTVSSSNQRLAVSEPFLKSSDVRVVYETLRKEQTSCERDAGVDGKVLNPRSTNMVVILGWLGAQQKHLRRYAEWYRARGINAVTFVIPMREILSLNMGSENNKSEQRIKDLAIQLATWLSEANHDQQQHRVLFHIFSNTGWLTYGVILENLLERDYSVLNKVKGCVVDSAPAADLDPQVWASGFSAALLRKTNIAVQNTEDLGTLKGTAGVADVRTIQQPKAGCVEVALSIVLEKFFASFLELPYVKQRLSQVVDVLSKRQPDCPQLYIYSSADTIIPAKFVESFIDEQRKAGRQVEACKLLSSPHVDHFRSFPELYSTQLSNFVKDCLPS